VYDRTKAEASLVVQQAVRDGLDAVIVCPTGVIGPHDYRRSEMGEMILSWMSPKASILVDGCFDFVDVRDVARGHSLAAKNGRKGETYILSGEQIAIPKMKDLVSELCGLPSRIIMIPMDLARFAARLAPLFYRLLHKRPRFTPYSLETITSNSNISNLKAKQELGYSARPLRESIADTVGWWLINRRLIKPTLRV
jgi:dihydroflavonol-4-reductase